MAFRHGTKARFYLHNVDVSSVAEDVELILTRQLAEVRPLAAEGVQRVAGLRDFTVTFAGLYEDQASARLWDILDDDLSGRCFALMPHGDATGNAAYLGVVRLSSKQVRVGDGAVKMPVQAASFERVERGVVLHPKTTRTASGETAGRDEVAQTSKGASGYLNCFDISSSGATLSVKIQHSSDNFASDVEDLIVFTSITSESGPTSELVRTASDATVKRYVRVLWTITSGKSATFFVGWHRNE